MTIKSAVWRKVNSRSLPNLNVLAVNGQDFGFIEKPLDSRTDKIMWRVFKGIGQSAFFVGHAKTVLESQISI